MKESIYHDRKLVYLIFILIGLCLILIAAIIKQYDPNGLASDVVKDIGIVVAAVALVDVLWNRFGGEPLSQQIEQLKQLNTLMQDADTSGLAHIFVRAADVKPPNWLSSIQNASHNIDLLGHTLYQMAERSELCAALVKRAQNGVKVRILINHPDNTSLLLAVDKEYGNLKAMSEQMVHTWSYFNSLRDQLPVESRDNFCVARLKGGVMHMALRRFDNTIYVLHYLYSQRSPDTPVYVVDGHEKPLFGTYMNEFERLFLLAEKARPDCDQVSSVNSPLQH